MQCYGEAWLELGRLYASKGDTNAARRYFVRAHTFARRAGLRKLRGHARHGLMRAAMAGDDYGAALHHGTMALREFRHDRERVDVVHDCAAVLLRQNPVDNAAACLGMLWEIIPSRRAGAERIASLLLVVRAAAVTGAADMLADAWFDAVHSIDLLGESCGSARLLLDLARAGSEAPGIDPARADEVARRAFNMAARVNDRAVALQADELRRELAGRGAP